MKRLAILLGLVLALVSVACGGPAGPRPPRRIFVVTIDTLRADHLGAYGYGRGVSPFLDELATRSVLFENAYSSCSHTAPSHASLFTALHPAQHRLLANGEELHEKVTTLAELLHARGYATGAFTTVSFLRGLRSGFDVFAHRESFHPAPEILGEALAWIRAQKAEAPLFVWIHLFDVHQWYKPEQVDKAALADVRAAGPRAGLPAGVSWVDHQERSRGLRFTALGPRKVRDAIERYDAQLLSTDRALQAFFSTLEAEGLAGDALWVIASDHGEGLGNHDYLGHGKTLYEEQIRVPLLIHSSDGRFTPRRVPGLVQLVDVAPTVAELAGTSFEAQVIPPSGRSLVPLLAGAADAREARTVFAQRRPADEKRLAEGWIAGDVVALRDARLKVIAASAGGVEVYDLAQDPFELHDLGGEPPPEREALLEGLWRQFRAMSAQGELVGGGEINPEYVEELKALGYL